MPLRSPLCDVIFPDIFPKISESWTHRLFTEERLRKYRAVYPEMTEQQRRIRATTAEEYWIPSVRVADAFVRGGGRLRPLPRDRAAESVC